MGLLHLLPEPSATIAFINRCKNFDGAYGCIPGAESHAGQSMRSLSLSLFSLSLFIFSLFIFSCFLFLFIAAKALTELVVILLARNLVFNFSRLFFSSFFFFFFLFHPLIVGSILLCGGVGNIGRTEHRGFRSARMVVMWATSGQWGSQRPTWKEGWCMFLYRHFLLHTFHTSTLLHFSVHFSLYSLLHTFHPLFIHFSPTIFTSHSTSPHISLIQ